MIRINKILRFSLVALMLAAPLSSMAQMTDQAVLDYITKNASKAKSKTQIANELLAKGVTAAQIKRVMSSKGYDIDSSQSMNGNGKDGKGAASKGTVDRNSSKGADGNDGKKTESDENSEKLKSDAEKLLRPNYVRKEDIFKVKQMYGATNPLSEQDSVAAENKKFIFGHNLFDNKNLTFEPNQNVAIPSDYVLGPQDELIIDIYGMNEDQITATISPEGRINIANVGPVYLSGLTIGQAKKKLRSALSTKYSLGGSGAHSDISITLGNIRTIQVNMLGEVNKPGTYRLSSLSTVLNALYIAGGVTPIGSLRSIRIMRSGKMVSVVDIYSLLFDDDSGEKIQLREGDMIVVPPYQAVVEIKDGVRRPMLYEAVPYENVGNIIRYAGGFTSDTYGGSVSVQRSSGGTGQVFTVKKDDFGTFGVCDGDCIVPYVNHPENQLVNMVTISGYVSRPGSYELGRDIATVRQLVEHAGGLLDGAFRQRAQLVRENPDRTLAIEGVAIGAIMDGTVDDIVLKKNDNLVISSIIQMEKKGDVEISGFVTNPGSYRYAEGMTVEDLIQLAGGLEEGASSISVEIGRRMEIADSRVAQDTIAQVFKYDFSGDLSLSPDSKFVLEPNDIVSVRKNPTFIPQRRVLVSGEVTFPGQYTLEVNTVRLSDIMKKAGGPTNYANIKGASLKRKISEYERGVRRNMVNIIKNDAQMDSLQRERLKVSEMYTIGINLEKAIASPGSDDDIILQDGDELVVPNLTNTVRIQGAVYYPNAVNYISGQPLSYYVNQAGGWSQLARRSKVYVVYMNGKVSVGMGSKIMPGSEIVVPAKAEKKKMTTGEWVGIGTAAASMAASLASVVTLLTK